MLCKHDYTLVYVGLLIDILYLMAYQKFAVYSNTNYPFIACKESRGGSRNFFWVGNINLGGMTHYYLNY